MCLPSNNSLKTVLLTRWRNSNSFHWQESKMLFTRWRTNRLSTLLYNSNWYGWIAKSNQFFHPIFHFHYYFSTGSPTDLVNVYRYSQKFQRFLNPVGAKYKFFLNYLKMCFLFQVDWKTVETCLSPSSSLITIAAPGVCKQSAASHWNLVCFVEVKNESPRKLRKNFGYLRHYSTNFNKIFIIMTSPCLTILTLVTDDLGTLG